MLVEAKKTRAKTQQKMAKSDSSKLEDAVEGVERSDKTSLSELVRDQVREGIQSGKFQPGERVRENDIAEWLGVSRTPVREALRQLEAEGLLAFVPWRGVVVAELDSQQVVELYKVRASLEGLAAALAAQHIGDTEIELLEALISHGEQSNDPHQLAKINKRFHETIYAASHNRYLIQNLKALQSSLALLNGTTYASPGRREQADKEHRDLFEAIRDRDPIRAEALARQHLKGAEVARLKMMLELP
jgi:DNA-binding GntR family transcriptional regulator